jgi:hypothetical protein
MIDDGQQTVRDCYNGLLLAQAPSEAVILSSEIVVFAMGDGPDHLSQDRSQVRIAFGGLATKSLAAALFVARAQSCEGARGV